MEIEKQRLEEARLKDVPWRKWGPYLSERQWGTVREDYSENGDAWNYFTHDQARSRAYKWGEDGLAGLSDDHQLLCWSLALWNGADPILKERLFGLSNSEGNHGEDVKEYYFYLDSTPTHSYMKYLYKYPQRPYPYDQVVRSNRGRSREEQEFELIDTGVFDDDRYFDVFVEVAKASPDDILIRIRAVNRGPDPADLHILPQLWFRDTAWLEQNPTLPGLRAAGACRGRCNPRQPPAPGRVHAVLRRRPGAAVHQQRDQRAAPVQPPQPHPLRQRRLPRATSSKARRSWSIRRWKAANRRRITYSASPPARRQKCACACARRRASDFHPFSDGYDANLRRAPERS